MKPHQALDRAFRVIAFDWDGTAVRNREEVIQPLLEVLERLLGLGTHLVVITGTRWDYLARQGLDELSPGAKSRLWVCTNRGSEVFHFDEKGTAVAIERRLATPVEDLALDRTAERTRAFLAERGIRTELISDRLNRRKIVLGIPNHQPLPSLAGVAAFARKTARVAGVPHLCITTDGRHLEIGLTDKTNSAEWIRDEFLNRRGFSPDDLLVVGDEFLELGGLPGSDALMKDVPGLAESVFVSVGPEALHSGPEAFLEILRRQLLLCEKEKEWDSFQDQICTRDPSWVLEQEGFDASQERQMESLFTIGNGYLGVRGATDLVIPSSQADLMLAGVYDQKAVSFPYSEVDFFTRERRFNPYTELVPFPSPFRVKIHIDGVEVTPASPLLKYYRRRLDLKSAVLFEKFVFRDSQCRETQIRTTKWVSLNHHHHLFQKMEIVRVNHRLSCRVDSSFEDPDTVLLFPHLIFNHLENSSHPGELSDLHFFETKVSRFQVAMAARTECDGVPCGAVLEIAEDDHRAVLDVRRTIAVTTSRDHECGAAVLACARQLLRSPELFFQGHQEAWHSYWEVADIEYLNNPEMTQAQRFHLYHLKIATDRDSRVSVGARGLGGRAYEGHVFWDAEVFVLPAHLHTDSEVARKILEYRHRTLPAARDRAKEMGCAGACFAWESTVTGEDVTPTSLNLRNHGVGIQDAKVPIFTGQEQIHVTAGVAFGVWRYWQSTLDREFMMNQGMEILCETARFWATRVKFDGTSYRLQGVVGPDEYHSHVDDNAYTNWMARFNLEKAAEAVELFFEGPSDPGYHSDYKEKRAEAAVWKQIASQIFIPAPNQNGVIEQFSGFFDLNQSPPLRFSRLRPPGERLLSWRETSQQKLIKQADVLMIPFLFPSAFTPDVLEANYRFYEPLTDHGSSLSPPVHAAIAAQLGLVEDFRKYWDESLHLDLLNLMGNTGLGIHLACMGGAWQTLIYHALGIQMSDRGPTTRGGQDGPKGLFAGMCDGVRLKLRDRGKTHPVYFDWTKQDREEEAWAYLNLKKSS